MRRSRSAPNFGLINSSVATDSTGTARLTYTAGYEIGTKLKSLRGNGNLITDTVSGSINLLRLRRCWILKLRRDINTRQRSRDERAGDI